jgi:O-antigen/teichoic acid export membrane protein
MGYTKNTIKGISWVSGARFISRGLAFLKIAILARVLSPTQFGLFGIASLLLSLLETLTETGINIVLIQSKTDLFEYINAAWVVSIIRGILISVFILVLSPFIVFFFHTPDALGIILFISLVPFVRGFINPAEVKFQKDLNFHLQFWFQSGLFLIDAIVSIIVVLITHSVFSMVWGMLISALVEVILSLIFIKPRPKLAIEKGYFKEIFHKGIWVTGYTIFNYFAENLDNIVIGRVMGAANLGLYQMAYKISILPLTEISDVVSSVAFPVYTKITDDSKRLQKAFFKTVFLVFFGSALLGIIIFFFPEWIIRILLGEKWLIIIPVLKILIIYGVLRTIAGPASALLLSLGKQKFVSVMVFIRFITLATFIYPLVMAFGLVGAGYAQLLSVIIELPVMSYFIFVIYRSLQRGKHI